jgi:large subunit ribosomal protein L23
MLPQEIVIRPIISEKSLDLVNDKKYTFEVAKQANKIEIKKAVEALFDGVEVDKVYTVNVLGKMKRVGVHVGRRASWKKAIVKLTESSKTIQIFEGLK